jgi:quercetin dioxygenase-like cupin family protein
MFSGPVWGEALLPHGDSVGVNRASFAPRSRTFWHRHPDGQILIGLAGSGLVVARDGTAVAIGDGITVHAPAGEEHWHGARDDAFMTHVSVAMSGATEWLDEVTEAEYLAALRLVARE